MDELDELGEGDCGMKLRVARGRHAPEGRRGADEEG